MDVIFLIIFKQSFRDFACSAAQMLLILLNVVRTTAMKAIERIYYDNCNIY